VSTFPEIKIGDGIIRAVSVTLETDLNASPTTVTWHERPMTFVGSEINGDKLLASYILII
jgi:hypothetical protein